jgi:hypothetical protein
MNLPVYWAMVAAGITLWVFWLCFVAIYNFVQRARALHVLNQPNPISPRADLLKIARDILGPDRPMKDVMEIADYLERRAKD